MRAPLDVAAAVLAAGRGSWLQRALRETGVVTSIAAYNYSPTELGVFGMTADLEAERVPAALDGIAQATARLGWSGRRRRISIAPRRCCSPAGRGGSSRWKGAPRRWRPRKRSRTSACSIGSTRRWPRRRPDDVRTVAARYLDPEAVSAVAYLPRDAAVGAYRGPRRPDLRGDGPSPDDGAGGLRAVAARAGAPSAGPSSRTCSTRPLPGADLLVRRKPGVPDGDAGPLRAPRLEFDPPGQAGLGALTVRSALRGAGGLDAGGLAFAAERLGGTLGAGLTSDWVGVGLTVLAERLGGRGRADRRRAPDARRSRIGMWRRSATCSWPKLDRSRTTCSAIRSSSLSRRPSATRATAFRSRACPRPWRISPAADARRWHQQALLAARPVIVAVGDVAPESAADVLAGVFESLPARAAGPALTPLEWALDSRPLERVVCRDKAQTALAMVFRGPDRRSPERFAAEVWAAVASGLGGRIFEALRDRRSLAYTVLASSWQKGRAGALVSYIATSPEREAEARAAMLEELDRFVREPVTASGAGAGGELSLRAGGGPAAARNERRRRGAGGLARGRRTRGSWRIRAPRTAESRSSRCRPSRRRI